MTGYVLFFFGGLVVGKLLTMIQHAIKTQTGTLQIDHSDPERDLYMIHINRLDMLNKKQYVMLKVDHNADLSEVSQR